MKKAPQAKWSGAWCHRERLCAEPQCTKHTPNLAQVAVAGERSPGPPRVVLFPVGDYSASSGSPRSRAKRPCFS